MDRIFRSRVGGWYYILMCLMSFVCMRAIMDEQRIITVCTVIFLFGLLHIYFSTYYIVTREATLVMRCSIFPRRVIEIRDILQVEHTANSAFSYALSMHRLLLRQKDKTKILISPEKEEQFVKLLLQLNPDIRLEKERNE
ncbi:PH domain-containing protein [Parabacteroides sp. Marseille-P3160]|uniref:PH domain-containing protein n=1 Tax=Parabacteroides sp. Marseille-P3160 TaxID=1917887 RepID=UPI0009BBC2CE|nr:PH domain-containing protein [Parabacteroides sp. Marseille-P3160]